MSTQMTVLEARAVARDRERWLRPAPRHARLRPRRPTLLARGRHRSSAPSAAPRRAGRLATARG
ncbi:hypothetical protein [Ornithinimicrobium humiphilum]|uniref:hypothetical protein n=1 Tax=Ornithinimicrobium humiphilum TaxID=125288 RepID=UPI00114F9C10|nr:hypothetical protein [Ornithinimicrobium humiphilum]